MIKLNLVIDRLLLGKDLSVREMKDAFRYLFLTKKSNLNFGATVLLLLQKKGIHLNELYGLVKLVHELEPPLRLGKSLTLVDGCGTGGDNAHTFNISTLACLVASGAGASIAKHGNRSISSQCGSSDLMESLGVRIDASPKLMLHAIEKHGFGYFHAPLYHPIFKRIQPIRQSLGRKGIKTIFNLVGPLVNPLRPKRQVIGVFRKDYAAIVAQTAKKIGYDHAVVFYNLGGFDELTIFSKAFLFEIKRHQLNHSIFNPRELKLRSGNKNEIAGKNKKYNTRLAHQILLGKVKGTKRNVVILNAAAILYVAGLAKSIKEGLSLSAESIDSGSAWKSLQNLVKSSHDSR